MVPFSRNLAQMVPFPAPLGPLSTSRIPSGLFILFLPLFCRIVRCFVLVEPVGDGLRLQGRQDDVAAVHDQTARVRRP